MTHSKSPADRPVLTVTYQNIDHRTRVLSVTGDLDHTLLDPLEEALADAMRAHPPLRLLVIDLAALGFCDSSGLNVFLKARQDTQQHGIELRLARPSRPLQRILELTGTAALFSLYDNLPLPSPDSRTCDADATTKCGSRRCPERSTTASAAVEVRSAQHEGSGPGYSVRSYSRSAPGAGPATRAFARCCRSSPSGTQPGSTA
ncbi:STAS domain-containing protein [Streptomyces sp. H27-H5]|uniref:STAS domain-containing protein n=1 Tax=Streptomyces sp. H27-H5 TaxID=2996460 RepID=UPI00227163C0|nr:STAS domain-containing protein [Streptomyces sp. H27-H5]MCY0963451.1 STAS domain-containing protein [Streptomyces sp. H27-H5]